MNILIIGINYAPEMVGIGPYTAGMAEWLVQAGHQVTVICAKPYYPQWKVDPAYQGGGTSISDENGVRVIRVPTYVPEHPDGKRRLLHHASFALRAEMAMLAETRQRKADLVMGIAPSLISMVVARHAARRMRAKLWLHIQDFEVEAAFATGLMKPEGMVASAARTFEKWAIDADQVSTISPQMCAKLIEKGVAAERVVELRNWANIDEIVPLERPSPYREEWGIDRPYVALYSGNIANKQGIEVILDAARILRSRKDLAFVVCGNGPNRACLIEKSLDLDNVHFYDLQPKERLSDLLGMATLHLLPQLESAADLVLPSKLINMLMSGRPIIATTNFQTGLAQEVAGAGIVVPPEDCRALAKSISNLLDNPEERKSFSMIARKKGVERWSKKNILGDLTERLEWIK